MQNLPQHTNRAELKSTHELATLMDDVLAQARTQGATDAAVAVSHDCGFSVNVRMGEVETVSFSEEKGVSVTVYMGQRKGSASSSDTSHQALVAMVSAAAEIAKVSAPDPCFGLPEAHLLRSEHADLDLLHAWDLTPVEAISRAQQCEAYALGLDARISNSDGVNVSTYAFCQGHANSRGFNGIVKSSRHGVSGSFIAKEGDKMQRDYEYTTARHPDGLMDLDNLARLAVEQTVSRLGARQINTQTCPVVFSPRVSSGLLSSLINGISGSNLYRKNSFLLDKIGQRLFPEGIRIYEQPYLPRALGSSPFDSEGVPTRPNVFVDDGILRQYALGVYSARKMGLETTANSGGVFNLTIDPTISGGLSDVLKQMGTGLLVTELMGQGVNILTGDYSRGASGFWVENGVIQYPVEEITIAGQLSEMFRSIVAVGSDINPNIATRCGSILMDHMTIAGQN